ncbi:hypothetical protein SLA2020_194030 [Shorea laevis]
MASRRRQNNYIFQLKDEHGIVLEGNESLTTHAYSHFQQAYTSQQSTDFDQLNELIRASVTAEMNEELCRPVPDKEIQMAAF